MEWSGAPYGRVGQVTDDSRELHEELQRAVFPRYQVGEEIGRGGMSVVFRGWDTAEMRSVAIKVLKQQYSTVLGPTRFLREIRLQTQLQHPGILPLLDSGRSDGLLYYTMPLVEGETLQARLAREPQLPLDTVRQILSQVAAALDYAHEKGVIHRDIKPSNLFVTGDRTLLADFGIAKDLSQSEQDSTTSTGLVLGTALYMSPEQADGQHHADRRADVYSLGCVAYQMIAGEPPFTGPTTQAVIARHRTMPAPSVRVVRPELPRGVDAVLRKALAKSPADRYQGAGEFASALSDPVKLSAAAAAAEGDADRTKSRPRWLIPLCLTIVAVAAATFALWPRRQVDSNKVVVFPLGETPVAATSEGAGIEVSLMLGSALEYTEPLEWIDGLPLLDERLRRDVGMLTAKDARRIARAAGAKWYVDGTVVRRRDSVTVVVRLNDAAGDSVVGRSSATRIATQAAQAGLAAINRLLPAFLSPGQQVADLSALADRQPAAVASWLQGEREYRRANFEAALEFARRAVAADSALAVAALRGAQAASWLNRMSEATGLAQAALRHIALLPPRMADFTRGLDAYVGGRADSAVYWLSRAVQRSPQWTEAHMALGEVYYHLLPSVDAVPDSLAQAEFALAAADTGFFPPRFHLAEIAVRRGNISAAQHAVVDFVGGVRSQPETAELAPMLQCVAAGREAMEWKPLASTTPLDVLRAATMLSAAAAVPGCAEDGFRAVFDSDSASLGYRWGAFLGLQGILAAEGRITELQSVIDTAVNTGIDLASQLYLLDALAGVDVTPQADEVARRLSGKSGEPPRLFTLWLLGAWRAKAGDRAGTQAARDAIAARAAAKKDPWAARLADVLSARLALQDGDTAATIAGLEAALGVGRRDVLDWDISESLAPERLLLAEIHLAGGRFAEALAVAGMFDHPAPIVFLPFLPASLAIREQAARALGRNDQVRLFQQRLAALGHAGDPARDSSPARKAEVP
jgi:tRNA A-37 threonylcarbamoyl transferase component Bud32